MKIFNLLKQPFVKEFSCSRFLFLLLTITVFVLPLIIRLHIFEGPRYESDFIALIKDANWDMYYYYKAVFLIFVSYLIFWCIILKRKKQVVRYAITCIMAFMFFIIISSVLSNYKTYAALGGLKSFQGVFVWMSYLFLCIAGMQLDKKQYFEKLVIVIIFSASILSVIGLLQFFDIHVLRFFEKLTLHSGYTFVNKTITKVHSLSFNPNYYGVYLSMILIINSCIFIFLKNKKLKIFTLVSYALIYANLVGSGSRAGNYAFILTMILLLIIIIHNKNRKFIKGFFSLLLVSTVVFLSMNLSNNNIYTKLSDMETNRVYAEIKELVVKDSILSIIGYQKNNLYLKVNKKGSLNISDEINFKKNLIFTISGDTAIINVQNRNPYKFIINIKSKSNENHIRLILNNGAQFPLIGLHKEQTFKTFDHNGNLADIICPEKWNFFNKRHAFASSRGIIWSLSFPIFKKTIFTGYGADTFALLYPNNDYFSKAKTGLKSFTIHSHSLYSQIGIEFGVIALVIFLAFMGIYTYQSLRLYWSSNFNDFYDFLGLGCFLAVCSFLFTGVFNSSMVSVSPYFWILFGMGIGINKINKSAL
jgi:hypothetical protein